MTERQSFYVAALLTIVVSTGCSSQGTDTGNATCAFPGCSFRVRATTPDGERWRGALAFVRPPNGIKLEASPVFEGGFLCVNRAGSLIVWFELSGTTNVWKDASGDMRATWTAGGPPDEFAPKVHIRGEPAVLATDLTLSQDGHLRATVTVDAWPAANASSTDAASTGPDAGSGVAQTITVEGPFEFSTCDGYTASLPLSDGTLMTFPCLATWSDPTVYVVAPAGRCSHP